MTHHSTECRADASMTVALIDQIDAFDALQRDWTALYLRDPDAHVFLDWAILRRAFADHPARWSVITVRSESEGTLIAALPLKYRVHWSQGRSELQTQLEASSRWNGGLYSGVLCDPQHETRAIACLARALTQIPWVQISMKYCPQLDRTAVLAQQLQARGCEVETSDTASGTDRKKRMSSKSILLPASMQDFLKGQLRSEDAKDHANWRDQAAARAPHWVSVADRRSFAADVTALREMLITTGDTRAQKDLAGALPVMETALDLGGLYMPIAWNDAGPLGALVHLHDPVQGTLTRLLNLVPGKDRSLRQHLSLMGIEHAIATDCLIYDCGRVGTKEVVAKTVHREKSTTLVARRDPEEATLRFDPLCTGLAIERLRSFVEKDDKAAALATCAQLSDLLKH